MKVWHSVGIGRADGRDVSEKAVQQACKRLLRLRGWAVWDTSQPYRAAITPGLPDLIALKPGSVLFVECKRATGKATRAQQRFLAAAQAAGAVALVAHSAAELADQLDLVGKV